jgi:hypothetical protein
MGIFLERVDDYSIDNSVAVKVAEDPQIMVKTK